MRLNLFYVIKVCSMQTLALDRLMFCLSHAQVYAVDIYINIWRRSGYLMCCVLNLLFCERNKQKDTYAKNMQKILQLTLNLQFHLLLVEQYKFWHKMTIQTSQMAKIRAPTKSFLLSELIITSLLLRASMYKKVIKS